MFGSDQPIFEVKGPLGVPVQFGSSIIFLAFIFLMPFSSVAQAVNSLIFFGLVVLAILLHEYGHAWATQVQGHRVTRVMIYGGGGFCERQSAVSPRQEEFIVAMGPLVNLALWAICGLTLDLFQGEPRYWVWLFGQINIVLFFLNLVPVQPLDGGKLLTLMLLRALPRDAAVRISGWIGLVFSALWILAMVWAFVNLSILLLFLPSIPLHWDMARGRL